MNNKPSMKHIWSWVWRLLDGLVMVNCVGVVFKPVAAPGLVISAIVALSWPEAGKTVGKHKVGSFRLVQTINVCTIFVISGLTLSTADLQAAVKAWAGFLYGLVSILIITPCLGFLMFEIPFGVNEYAVGLAVFASVPTTLTSGVTMVMQAGGNSALALMLTVCSNILGVITTPAALSLLVREGDIVKLDTEALLLKMALTMLVPLVVGKFVREVSPPVKKFCSEHSKPLSLISNFSLIMVVWQSLSRSQEKIVEQSFVSLLEVIAAGIGMHLIYLVWNFVVVRLLRLERKEEIAVVLLASQKTLPVSVTVISFLSSDLGNDGLITIPCIVAHMAQLFIDAYIVSKWAESNKPAVGDTTNNNQVGHHFVEEY